MNLWQDKNIKPMLLKEIDKPFNDNNYLFEVKFDGIRAIVYASPKKVIVKNRYDVDITDMYPELQSIKNIVNNNVIFDGEIIALENELPSFLKLQERIHLKSKEKILFLSKKDPVIFIAFDILYEDKNLINKSLIERKAILNKYKENDVFVKSKWLEDDGVKLYNAIKKLKMEGIVAKLKDSVYEIDTRTSNWVKIKNWQVGYFFIGGYTEKINSLSLYLGEIKKDRLLFVGKVSLNKNRKLYEVIRKSKKVKNNPFYDYSDSEINYLKDYFKVKVKYLEKTSNNHLRQPFLP